MKRILFLTLAAAFFTSCERPTAPATHDPPAFELTAPTSTTFSGEATVLQAQVLGLQPIVVGRAGPVSESGGAEESSVLSVSKDETGGLLSAEVVHAAVVAQGNSSSAEASVASANLTVADNAIQADLLRSQAVATCDGGQASASGSSEVAGLVINGTAIAVSGNPNQTENLPGLRVVINEQSGSANGNRADITVNALHVTAFNPLSGQTLADVIISSAHADIRCAGACPPPVGDFVTGGGWITGTPSGARANFAVAGGIKNGGLWGHLTYIDHGPNGIKVKGTGVTSYEITGPTSRRIKGTAEVNGVGGIEYTVDVTDAGEPGRDDMFSITLSNDYHASGKLAGGNIQLHPKPGACP
jgi:hypothetical protein